jgi:tetratricopeptide (TPR) repeat protein
MGYREILKRTQPGILDAADEPSQFLMKVKLWLESKESGDWLLVVDSLDDSDIEIGMYIPKINGALIFTTQDRRLVQKYKTSEINVDVMSREDARGAFFKLIGFKHDPKLATAVDDLLEVLGDHSLAISQATAYVREIVSARPTTSSLLRALSEYTKDCIADDRNQFKLLSEPIATEELYIGHSMPRSVMDTWTSTIQKIQTISPNSVALLDFMSFLDPEKIPADLLECYLATGRKTKLALNDCMRPLVRFSFLTRLEDDNYRLHRLVSLWTRVRMSPSGMKAGLETALEVLWQSFPDSPFETALIRTGLMPHVSSVHHHINRFGMTPLLDTDMASSLYHNVGSHFVEQIMYDEALEWYRRAVAGREKVLGGEHPDTLYSISIIAAILHSQGKYDEAIEWHGRTLVGRQKVLGHDDPDTQRSIRNLRDSRDKANQLK